MLDIAMMRRVLQTEKHDDLCTLRGPRAVTPCFTPGTHIATPRGLRLVENLRIGDPVVTRDNGVQHIRWTGLRGFGADDLRYASHLQPVLVLKDSLGDGVPERDMLVSPNHRLLVSNDKALVHFDEPEVLVAAKHLTGVKGVDAIETTAITYLHLMFDRHEVILADGVWTESFQPEDDTLAGLDNARRSEILEIFPKLRLKAGRQAYGVARRVLSLREALKVVQ